MAIANNLQVKVSLLRDNKRDASRLLEMNDSRVCQGMVICMIWQSGHLCDRMEVSVMHSNGNVIFWNNFQFSVSL